MSNYLKSGKIGVDSPNAAFERAIKKGLKNPDQWMYLYSKDGKDYFKNPNASSVKEKYKNFKSGGLAKRGYGKARQ